MEIKEIIQRLADKNDSVYSVIATVTSIDEEARIIDALPINGDAELFNIKLQAAESGSTGFVCIPKENSQVVVTFLSKDLAFVSLQTDIEKILIDTDNVTFNGGNNGGLINIESLVTKVNNLENLVNSLLTTLKTTVIPLAPSGAYPFAPLYASTNLIAPTTQKSDLEDTKITH